jgi:hypothetical protein
MTDRQFAATPWEVEAERRREVIAADARDVARAARSDAADEVLTAARGRRLLPSLRESLGQGPRRSGGLDHRGA